MASITKYNVTNGTKWSVLYYGPDGKNGKNEDSPPNTKLKTGPQKTR